MGQLGQAFPYGVDPVEEPTLPYPVVIVMRRGDRGDGSPGGLHLPLPDGDLRLHLGKQRHQPGLRPHHPGMPALSVQADQREVRQQIQRFAHLVGGNGQVVGQPGDVQVGALQHRSIDHLVLRRQP